MKNTEYTVDELKQFMEVSQSMYDVIRLVDPTECKVIHLCENGIEYREDCFSVWRSDKRCKNCSSYKACISGHRREKEELHDDNLFHIQSNPITLQLDEVGDIPLVIEFITKTKVTDQDVSYLEERSMEDLEEFARDHDALTGLLNWDGYSQCGRRLLEKYPEETWLIIAADVKQFKLINSLFGKQKGNEILLEIANLTRPYEHCEEIIFGRLMADQFAVFMPKSLFDQKKLDEIVDRVQKTLSQSVYRLKIHVGIYQIDRQNLPFSVMYDRAVMALMEARDKDLRTAVWFDQELQDRLIYRQGVIRSFEHTIGGHEYDIFLQPQVNQYGEPVGAEALARWVHPDGTVVVPDKFIPILEDAGLIAQLDQEIWEQAIEQLAMWKGTQYENYYISVNIAPHDFVYIDVIKTLTEMVERYDIDSSRLRLEITEEAILGDFDDHSNQVEELRNAGFIIMMDDFGKSYTSINMICKTPLDAVKIDMSFLLQAEYNERCKIVLELVISMARGLEMDVIAQGVETQHQFDMLERMGCRTYQGFLFERPLSVAEFEEKYG